MSTGKIVLGTLAGLAIGAIAGILFAPEKGSKTRKQIMDKGDGYVEDLKSKFDEMLDTLTEKFEHSKNEAKSFANKSQETYNEVKNEVKNTAADIKHSVS
ncbi:MAG: YtxH domain-containing protein [Flavobacteriia bacterium]|nr:YtxH domain-containing protein [Flavobacteriia bacterium]OIP48261.1 MAG: gas vesicle protein [Flavobacteriaceae bacterium CG2_30_31_66]PIV96623.1 MAG: YtxH domain-containing protein [Flavobacteriaceae bacterium CG17_big_fil_post_rev_8_21_14_2_50_31_13]PIX15438.1 MAG: YtxH domain-containing protein [Flavobacteriaceae bacterium CG_4_8_14_3_um_filter_31_8]PIY14470.1 MAG: YtxH domain-containing protein [Flavobacteriaceae bacterium CG_4_10_14_3_um_filter_31_253]PIZ10057.1 MAG: YtxH domain-contai